MAVSGAIRAEGAARRRDRQTGSDGGTRFGGESKSCSASAGRPMAKRQLAPAERRAGGLADWRPFVALYLRPLIGVANIISR